MSATQPATDPSVPTQPQQPSQDQEVQQLLAQAAQLALNYEFQQAVDLLDSFSGDKSAYPELAYKRGEYAQQASQMVTWADPSQIVNLSFHGLIANPTLAFAYDEVHNKYAKDYNKNFVTIGEFSQILEQVYANGYVLVSLDDIFSVQADEGGNISCAIKPLQLPLGKKPLVLTQTMINYYGYMINSKGFPSKLVVDANGKFSCEMVDANGNTVTGDFDLVPILESFIAQHPDFSYKGARAVLALTGDEGIFGYRGDQLQNAKPVVDALKARGYELACYTYANKNYGLITNAQIQSDLNSWAQEITPILGETRILAFARNGEISSYSGDKFNTLQNAGFRIYLDFGSGRSGAQVSSNYISFQRLMVTGSAMAYSAASFTGMFDADAILDSQRGTVPRS